MPEATIVLELVLGKWLDAGTVTAVLFRRAALGLVQEGRARAPVALLRQALAANAPRRVATPELWIICGPWCFSRCGR